MKTFVVQTDHPIMSIPVSEMHVTELLSELFQISTWYDPTFESEGNKKIESRIEEIHNEIKKQFLLAEELAWEVQKL